MNQEHRVDYDVVKRDCDDIAFEMNLPMDRFAVRTRDNYIKAIYNSCYQCVTPYNEMAYKWVNPTINGNLASWYANEYSIYKNAPMEWQKDAKETIVGMFKEAYPEREDLKEDYEEYGLPTSFSVLLSDAEKAEMAYSEDEEEFVSDYITNKYGFCHNGFNYDIVGDELIVSDVQWDIDEEDEFDDDELDENLTQDSISGDTLMQEVYDFIISESNEDRLVPFDVVRNMMNERGLRLEDYFNDLLIRDGQEGLLLKTIDGDQYIGPVSLLDKRSDEVAIVKREEQKLEKSVNRLQDKIDGEIAAERKRLEDATYGDIDELVDNVKYIYVEAPRARKYQPLIRKLFGQDADKVHITKSDNPNAKWSISADIYIKDVDKLPAALKAKVNSNGTISSIGLAVELYRAGAKLSGSKEVKESFGAHLLKEAKDPVQRRYKSMSKAKWASLGETMTLKDALDLWWNSVRIDGEIYYKTHTGNYETPEDDIPEELLNRKITLWNEYDNDSDGYPIVYADWSEELKEAKDTKDKMYVGIWDDAQDDFVEYKEFNDFQDALEFASKYDYSKIKSGIVKFDTNSLFTKGFASEFDIVDGKTDLKAMQELMPKKDVNEDYDDWEESGIYGGDLTYCPICDTRLKYDEDGDHYCPKCKEDAHSLSMKRRHLMKESKVSPLDRAVEIYTTVLDPYGNLNSPFDNEEDYIQDLKDSFKNKQYAEYFISEYEDDDDAKAQEFVSLLKNIHSIKEAVDTTKAKEVKKNSDAWAVLYGYKFRNEPEVELEPEEHDEKSLRARINEIVSSYNGKGDRPSKNAKETDFIFYVLYK